MQNITISETQSDGKVIANIIIDIQIDGINKKITLVGKGENVLIAIENLVKDAKDMYHMLEHAIEKKLLEDNWCMVKDKIGNIIKGDFHL